MTVNKMTTIIKLMRPGHWVKNGFVIAPLLFAHKFNNSAMCIKVALTFAAFCAVSSIIYIINDMCDRREDQNHPTKKNRPIASGAIGISEAIMLSIILTILGFAAALTVSYRVTVVVLLYAAINLIYSLKIKHIAILDVMTIAAGFVLRVLAGSSAISVLPSHWLILCTIMISLFLGFTKRRAELIGIAVDGKPNNTRIVLKDYSVAFLDQVIAVVTGATVVCYALYTVDARTVEVFGSRAMLLTVPPVIYGIFRYIYIIYHLQKGDDPTKALFHDIPTLVNLVIWITIAMLVVTKGADITELIHLIIKGAV